MRSTPSSREGPFPRPKRKPSAARSSAFEARPKDPAAGGGPRGLRAARRFRAREAREAGAVPRARRGGEEGPRPPRELLGDVVRPLPRGDARPCLGREGILREGRGRRPRVDRFAEEDAGRGEVPRVGENPVRLLAGEERRSAALYRRRGQELERRRALHARARPQGRARRAARGASDREVLRRGRPQGAGAGLLTRRRFDALFLDRDGTLVAERGFLGDPKDVRLAPGAAKRLRAFQRQGTALFIVTNQSGLARGFLTREQVDAVNAEIVRRYAARGVLFAGVLVCPHHPEGVVASLRRRCRCRKPGTLLHERALRARGLSARRSAVVGDKWDDVGSGVALGAATVHVLTGHGRRERPLVIARAPGAILATTLADALDQLLPRAPTRRPPRRSA